MQYYDLVNQPCTVSVKYRYLYVKLSGSKGIYTNDYTTVERKKEGEGNALFVTSKKPFCAVKFTWHCPDFAKNALVYYNDFERGYGHVGWYKRYKAPMSFWYFGTTDKISTYAYGVMTGCSSYVRFETTPNTISLICDCRNGSFPVELGERTLRMCTLLNTKSQEGENAFYTMRRFCGMLCPNRRLASAPVYGHNSWYYINSKPTAETIKADADLLAELTEGLENRPYCVLDDGWMTCHMSKYKERPEDTWTPNLTKFPDMKELTDYIHAKDMKAGIWIRALLGSTKTPDSWRLQTGKKGGNIYLDPSNPEVLQEVATIVKRVKDWGFDLIKHDYSAHDISGMFPRSKTTGQIVQPGIRFQDRSKTTAEITLDFYRTLRESAGDNVLLLGCNTISHLSAGIFEVYRIGDDTSAKFWWKVPFYGINSLTARAHQHNLFYACDADCVGHMNIIPWEKNKKWLELVAKSGTPLFGSVDPTLMTDEIKEDLRKAYALSSKQEYLAEPLDWLENKRANCWKVGEETIRFDWDKK